MWPFEPAEESPCFLRGLLELMTEAKNINIHYIFDVKSHVIAKRGNCSEEIAGRWKNNSVCQICLQGVVRKVSKRKKLTGETFFLLEKRLLSTIKCCASSNLLFFYKLLIGPRPTFSECIVITCISRNPIGQLCLSGPGYTCRTVMWLQVTTKTWQSHLQWMQESLKLKWVFFYLDKSRSLLLLEWLSWTY